MAKPSTGSQLAGIALAVLVIVAAAWLLWPDSRDTDTIEREYITLEWTDLLPPEDLEALLNPPEWLDEIEDGAPEDTIDSDVLARDDAGRRFQQALQSTSVMGEFDQQTVRIPGFVVPLDFNEKQEVTEFFLVPYFGACIHLPPPPPNQLIHVSYPRGLPLERLDDAVWVEGFLTTAITDHELGKAAYALAGDSVIGYMELYKELGMDPQP